MNVRVLVVLFFERCVNCSYLRCCVLMFNLRNGEDEQNQLVRKFGWAQIFSHSDWRLVQCHSRSLGSVPGKESYNIDASFGWGKNDGTPPQKMSKELFKGILGWLKYTPKKKTETSQLKIGHLSTINFQWFAGWLLVSGRVTIGWLQTSPFKLLYRNDGFLHFSIYSQLTVRSVSFRMQYSFQLHPDPKGGKFIKSS